MSLIRLKTHLLSEHKVESNTTEDADLTRLEILANILIANRHRIEAKLGKDEKKIKAVISESFKQVLNLGNDSFQGHQEELEKLTSAVISAELHPS